MFPRRRDCVKTINFKIVIAIPFPNPDERDQVHRARGLWERGRAGSHIISGSGNKGKHNYIALNLTFNIDYN